MDKYVIWLNSEREIAVIEADSEKEALKKFASEKMNHGEIEVKEDETRFYYENGDNVFSVDKLFIWNLKRNKK